MSKNRLFSRHDRSEGPDPQKPPEGGGGKRPSPFMAPRPLKTLAFWLMMTVLVLLAVNVYQLSKPEEHKITFGEFYSQVLAGNIQKVTISASKVTGKLKAPYMPEGDSRGGPIERFYTTLPAEADTQLWKEIRQYNPNVDLDGEVNKPNWFGIVLSYLPIILIIAFWLFFMRQMQSGGSAAMRFGKSKAKLLIENKPKVTFRDVAGADEAKEELQEIIEFLSDPKKFQVLGGRIPKGALLLGPPGTGKTLLAKAVAGEAGVPFFSMSGSDFVEMFVGVGASRVRDLFEQGKRNAPCIMFIDEIDAVGRHRGAGLGGGHDEREQTLNQLLVEMDGFESTEGVILLAATNRPDVLDPALLRPGRFDRQVVVDAPDVKGREGILKVHTRKIPLGADVKLEILARGTPGMVGADLANMVNEAALLAARRNHRRVTMRDFEDSKDKVMMGAERKSRVFTDEEKKVTAFHEAGHAIVGWMTPDSDPIHKVTIIPRGQAMGVTHFLPIDDRHTYSRKYCLGVLARAMGGRAAEELVFDQITTGAGSDIEQATKLSRRMVSEWGMSDLLGPVSYREADEAVFLGKEFGHTTKISGNTQQKIDSEIHRLVDEAHQKALTILRDNMDRLDRLAEALLEREILGTEEVDQIMRGEALDPPTPVDNGEGEEEESTPEEQPQPKPFETPYPDPDPNPGPA